MAKKLTITYPSDHTAYIYGQMFGSFDIVDLSTEQAMGSNFLATSIVQHWPLDGMTDTACFLQPFRMCGKSETVFSVTRWLEYFSNIGPFTPMKICPIANNCQCRFKLFPNTQ